MKNFLTVLVFLFIGSKLYPQQIVNPLDTPMVLSATFGELRANHFHSGIDIKTDEITGKPVRSIEDGYIYRIKVSPYGYGNALYIMHYNGYTSVYGHLCCFTPKIDSVIRSQMYKKQKNSIEFFPKVGLYKVKKGEIIAYSGNSGSSHGPHLHFEIRNSKNEHPLNPLNFHLAVHDTIKPVIKSIAFYDINGLNYQYLPPFYKSECKEICYLGHEIKKFSANNDTIKVTPITGIVMGTVDFVNNSSNVCGIYGIDLKLDGKSIFKFNINEFSFYETRYINSLMDYRTYIKDNTKLYRLFKQPNNRLSFLKNSGRGIIQLKDTLPHKVEIYVYDTYGNTSYLTFWIKKGLTSQQKLQNGTLFKWKETTNKLKGKKFELSIPGKALYDNMIMVAKEDSATNSKYLSEIVNLDFESTIPLHKRCILKIKPNTKPNNALFPKLTIVKLDGGKMYDVGGNYIRSGFVETKIRSFGKFTIAVDTIPPQIKPVNIYEGKRIEEDSIAFKVTDNLTGIGGYSCFIDGKWTRITYDIKEHKLYCKFKETTKKENKSHKLILTVTDEKSNFTVYKANFVF